MNTLYISIISDYQANGNQIDINKKIALNFFGLTEDEIRSGENKDINVCHINDLTTFEIIPIQTATNIRFSTKLNTLFTKNNDKLEGGDLLIVEKLGISYCVRSIKEGQAKYDAILDLFDKGETHMLLTAIINSNTLKNSVPDSTYKQYLTAIRTKPFILLAGISGTGKSRIVRKLAQATDDIDTFANEADRWECHSPANFQLIQVKPNWHNSMDMVGYKSNIGGEHYEFTPFVEFVAKAWQHPKTPFFLCLDEMNLAPVEEYFAEYLSAIESRTLENGEYDTDPIIKPFKDFGEGLCAKMITKLLGKNTDNDIALRFREKGLTLPPNLIVMGTVNMDDTTFSFSRKVLDRAMSIEMNEVDYDAFLNCETEDDVPVLVESNALIINRPINGIDVNDNKEAEAVIEYLKEINTALDGTPFKLGYRAANEALLYVAAAKTWGNNDIADALDQFTLMKILSRIEGDESKLMTEDEKTILDKLRETIKEYLISDNRKSIQKIDEMIKILKRDHFVSYWA